MSLPVAFQPFLPFGDGDSDAGKRADDARPRESLLMEELARVCRERPLDEKVLLVPSLAIGHQLLERLARGGTPWVHLRVETVRTLAHGLLGPELVSEGRRLLSRAQALALVEQACAEALRPESYFGPLRDRPGLHRALHATLNELRAAGLDEDRLPAGAFADGRKHGEIRDVLRGYRAALEQGRYVDAIEVLRRALRRVPPAQAAGGGTLYLLPAITELSALEREFVERLAAGSLLELATDPPEAWKRTARRARLLRAIGEENEIREVFRRILAGGIPFDQVEILHTDPSVYPALCWELSREHEIPCTFAGGISVTFTRPGRAALAFLDWIGQGFAADLLRRALSSGALTLARLPGSEDGPGTLAAARAIREAGIGWGRERHLRCVDRLLTALEKTEQRSRREAEFGDRERTRGGRATARELAAARLARDFLRRALEFAPASSDGPADLRSLARGARRFVSDFGRVTDEMDGTARTALDALFEEIEELVPLRLTVPAAVARLRDAVAALSIAADRPRPGRIHVAHYGAGGFSGRPHTFLVGLDEARHPGRDLEDPVLLDEERRRLNDTLPRPLLSLGRERPRESAAALRACVARLPGNLTASYSSFGLRDLSMPGEPSPSPFLLDLYRQASGRPDSDYRDLAEALRDACGFVPAEEDVLDDTEWWLARLRRLKTAPKAPAAALLVRSFYPWLEGGHRAAEARAGGDFTVWDGWVRRGTPELDPRENGKPFSASRIQELARCPFSYFVRHALGVEPLEEPDRDPARWLSPLEEGSLLHEVFREFLERLTRKGQKPQAGHLDLLLGVAEERIAEWRERVAPRSGLAFSQTRDNILFACRTFLKSEEERCREVTPRYFEVPFGQGQEASPTSADIASADPVALPAGGGRTFLLRGAIDRVDQAPDGTFHVWDYKTGSAWNIREGLGVRGGRQIQPALYAMAFEALLERAGRPATVSQSGYFLPGKKGEGQRLLTDLDPEETQDVLGRLFDLLAAGMFPHAQGEEDCGFCAFEAVCGGARWASDRAREKLAQSADPVLAAFREIHAEKKD